MLKKLNQLLFAPPKWEHRPWGRYRVIWSDRGYLVKVLEINPGQAISLQKHAHRHEYWTVVSGEGIVTDDPQLWHVDDRSPKRQFSIPKGRIHQVENTGKTTLTIIEVQFGATLDENDIERLADRYGRATTAQKKPTSV